MFAITGITGKVGCKLARTLLAQTLFRRLVSEVSAIADPVLDWNHEVRRALDALKEI
jgi:nucleoside-diphosphate-sugar epimerase